MNNWIVNGIENEDNLIILMIWWWKVIFEFSPLTRICLFTFLPVIFLEYWPVYGSEKSLVDAGLFFIKIQKASCFSKHGVPSWRTTPTQEIAHLPDYSVEDEAETLWIINEQLFSRATAWTMKVSLTWMIHRLLPKARWNMFTSEWSCRTVQGKVAEEYESYFQVTLW